MSIPVPSAAPGATPNPAPYRQLHFDRGARPFLVLWELTRACDLACIHCRAESRSWRDPGELSTAEIREVLDDLAALGAPRPIVVLTGGDPFKRPDLSDIVSYGTKLSLRMAVSPSGTPLATRKNLAELRLAGATAVSFSIDGASAESHDSFRRVPGSFDLTVNACREAVDLGFHLQVNTTVTSETVDQLPCILRLVSSIPAGLWSLFFIVPTGRGRLLAPLSAEQVEDVLLFLAEVSEVMPVKSTEAPQYRRILVQREASYGAEPVTSLYTKLMREVEDLLPAGSSANASTGAGGNTSGHDLSNSRSLGDGSARGGTGRGGTARRPLVVGDGYGVVFISHTGEVSPSGFLPMVVGNVRDSSIVSIYRESELLNLLRSPSGYGGRCGICEYRDICGGSRAQAFAAYGDPLAEDPNCPFQPAQSA